MPISVVDAEEEVTPARYRGPGTHNYVTPDHQNYDDAVRGRRLGGLETQPLLRFCTR
ncbi:hypothetical protein [Mycobacterium lepromatosis]|uniref:hypothetical protein n=1 Tax=Mycobacterium lepromatosis TaxID=480418 RepID=UPI0012E03E77|nr:hypothetical protein [Mycobacterium lepromatosis]